MSASLTRHRSAGRALVSGAKASPPRWRRRGARGRLCPSREGRGDQRAYGSDFAIFKAWAAEHGAESLPALPATVAAFYRG